MVHFRSLLLLMQIFFSRCHAAANVAFRLLDEPTSNLDSLNEGIILKSLKESAEEKTIVLVSHRVSTMNVANVVYEMENGRIS